MALGLEPVRYCLYFVWQRLFYGGARLGKSGFSCMGRGGHRSYGNVAKSCHCLSKNEAEGEREREISFPSPAASTDSPI
jgi:hypothetical protein